MEESYPAGAPLHMARSLAFLLAATFAMGALAQLPQQTAATIAPPLTVNVRLVVLDVAVTDNAGRPIDGLSAKDFQIYEDGKMQQIKSVEPPSAHMLPAATAAEDMTTNLDPAQPTQLGSSPVTVLMLDQLNTHFADSSFARRCLHEYLAGQPALLPQPTTLLSISDAGFKILHPLTRDRDALTGALDIAPPEYAWKLEVNGKADYGPIERLDRSLRSLEQIAESYARVPGRKNLIWVGGGFPSLDPATIDRDDAREVRDVLRHVTDLLLDTRVTLYAVDPTSSAAGTTEITDSTQLQFAELAGDALTTGSDPFNSSEDFDRLGPLTGGRVVRARNDVAQQIASAIASGANFYTLAYAPNSAGTAAAKFRKIRVVCLRAGCTASTRIGYYPSPVRQTDPKELAAYDLTTAAESTVPLNGLTVSVALGSASNGAGRSYLVHVKAADLSWKPQPDGSATASVYVMAVDLNRGNRTLGHTLEAMTATAKPGANLNDPARTADFPTPTTTKPHTATLRFIVRDSATGRMGSFDLPLTGR